MWLNVVKLRLIVVKCGDVWGNSITYYINTLYFIIEYNLKII